MIIYIGLSLSFITIGILYYLNNELNKKLKSNNRALLALQQEFSEYQVKQTRYINESVTRREIRFDNVAKSIKKNEDAIYSVNQKHKDLPKTIRKVIGHIEFARPLDKNK